MKNTIVIIFALLFLITFNNSCKSSKETVEEKPIVKQITLVERLDGLTKMTRDELGDYMVTIDGKTLPVYDVQGSQLEGAELIAYMRENEFAYEVYGNEKNEPSAIVLKEVSNEEIKEEEIPLPPGMDTKLEYAPAFSAKDMNGKEWSLDKLKGKIAVLNFWFINCAPCVEEIPDLNGLKNKYANNKNVEFIAITFDSKADVKTFLQKNPFNYNIITDANKIMDDYIVVGFPTNILLDKNNDIIHQSIGYRHQIDKILDKKIEGLLRK